MKALVIGNGSIGKRHTINLRGIGVEVETIDVDDDISTTIDVVKPDIGLVCTPTNLHLDHALILAKKGINFFCEKPLFTEITPARMKKIEKINLLISAHELLTMVGCNLRFNKTLIDARSKIDDDLHKFDHVRIKSVESKFGFNLAKWHNDGKHRESYSANKSMGGGIAFDAIHEFDYIDWMFGDMKSMDLFSARVGNVTVDSDDVCIGSCMTFNHFNVTFKLDYLSDVYTRSLKITTTDNVEHVFHIVPTNEMYVDEMKHFVSYAKERIAPMNSFLQAVELNEKLCRNIRHV